ncbi:MAG: O-antigen ligase family protein [Patescibacteria group bacterium]
MPNLERVLLWSIRILFGLLLFFTPLIISPSLFFPYITGKNFFFRIIVELMLSAWGALAILNAAYRPRMNMLFASVTFFIGSLTLATIFGANPYHSFWSNFERMEGLITYLHLFALFLVLSATLRTKKEWAMFLHISLASGIIMGLYGTCEHFFYSHDPFTQAGNFCKTGSGGTRIYATLGNFIYLTVFMMFNMFFTVVLFFSVQARWQKSVYFGVFLFDICIFLLAGSRGPVVGLGVACFVMASCFALFVKNRRYKYMALGVLGLIIILTLVLLQFKDSRLIQENPFLSRLSSLTSLKLADQPRFKIWKMGIHAFQERPLFGWGPENFIIPYAKYYDPTLYGNEPWFDRVHNMSLEWLVDAGIVGFASYLCMLIAVFYTISVCVRKKKIPLWMGVLFVGLLVAYIVQNLFVFDTITNYIYYFSLLAFLHTCIVEDKSQKHSRVESGQLVGASFAILLGFVMIFVLNVRPIQAASQLLVALSSTQNAKTTDDILTAFKGAFDLGTFGISEMRERLADITMQGVQATDKPQIFLPLLDKSIGELTREVEENPQVAKNLIFLAKLQSARVSITGKDASRAEASYEQALALAPNYPQTYLGLAEFYLITGQNEKATVASTKALELAALNSDLFYTVLSSYVLAEDYIGAKKMLEKYIGGKMLPPYNAHDSDKEIRILIQRSLRTNKNLADKIEFYKELNKEFDHPFLFVGFAQTYGQMGNRAKAREYALKAAEADPTLQEQVNKFLKSLDSLP